MDETSPSNIAGPSGELSNVAAGDTLPIKRRTEHKRKSGGSGKKGKIFLEDKVGFTGRYNLIIQLILVGWVTELGHICHRVQGCDRSISSSQAQSLGRRRKPQGASQVKSLADELWGEKEGRMVKSYGR